MAQLKPVAADPRIAATAPQAALLSAGIVREFLKANGVNTASGSPDAKASVMRVICVSK
jgi:hypothetical protein